MPQRAGVRGGLAPVERVGVLEPTVLQELLPLEQHRDTRARHHDRAAEHRALAAEPAARVAGPDLARHALLAVGDLVMALRVDDALLDLPVVPVEDRILHREHVAVGVVGGDQVATDVGEETGVPLAVEARAALAGRLAQPRVQVHVLGDHELPGLRGIDRVVDPLQQRPALGDVHAVLVGAADVLGAIHAEAVHPELLQPHHAVVLDVGPHLAARVVGTGVPPRGVQPEVVEEVAAAAGARVPVVEPPQVHVVGTEVVEDHVAHHGDAARVSFVDEGLEVVRRAVRALHAVRVRRVVAPRVIARELVDRHERNGVHAKILQVLQLLAHGGERSRHAGVGREVRARVHLVHHELAPRRHRELVLPGVRRRVVDHGVADRTRQVAGPRVVLPPAGRASLDEELVALPCRHEGNITAPVAVELVAQRVLRRVPSVEGPTHRHALGEGREDPEGGSVLPTG